MAAAHFSHPVPAASAGVTPDAAAWRGYFAAIVCIVCDSPVDALVALCVRREEAMMLVHAARHGGEPGCIVALLHGGRPVAVVLTPEGRWAACNAFLDEIFATPQEAGRRLDRLLRRGRRGCVGRIERMPGAG